MNIKKLQTNSIMILRFGLASVFIANSYVAFFHPDEFVTLVNSELLVKFIGISDLTVAVLLSLGLGLKYVSIYATLWILGVMAVIGIKEPADFLEHFGFLSIAVYLFVNCVKPNNKPLQALQEDLL